MSIPMMSRSAKEKGCQKSVGLVGSKVGNENQLWVDRDGVRNFVIAACATCIKIDIPHTKCYGV